MPDQLWIVIDPRCVAVAVLAAALAAGRSCWWLEIHETFPWPRCWQALSPRAGMRPWGRN